MAFIAPTAVGAPIWRSATAGGVMAGGQARGQMAGDKAPANRMPRFARLAATMHESSALPLFKIWKRAEPA
jgi:hypothetical protein